MANFVTNVAGQKLPTFNPFKQNLPDFVKVLPSGKWSFTLDNQLSKTFSTCERKFAYRHIDNIGPKGEAGFKLMVGTWWSSVMKDYYEALADARITEEKVQNIAARQ